MKYATDYRNKYCNGGSNEFVRSNKTSRYNSKFYVDRCDMCKTLISVETHHIQEQHRADVNGFIGHFHKNRLHNLMSLCRSCHIKVHSETEKHST